MFKGIEVVGSRVCFRNCKRRGKRSGRWGGIVRFCSQQEGVVLDFVLRVVGSCRRYLSWKRDVQRCILKVIVVKDSWQGVEMEGRELVRVGSGWVQQGGGLGGEFGFVDLRFLLQVLFYLLVDFCLYYYYVVGDLYVWYRVRGFCLVRYYLVGESVTEVGFYYEGFSFLRDFSILGF